MDHPRHERGVVEEEEKLVNLLYVFVDDHLRAVQIGAYAVGVLGCFIAVRNIRPLQKFSSVKDVPTDYIQRHKTLRGKVLRVEVKENDALLFIDHEPRIKVKVLNLFQTAPLPVQILGVNATPSAFYWMHHTIEGKNASFKLMKKTPNYLSCIVEYQNGKRKNVADELLSIGFASVAPWDFDLGGDRTYLNYYRKLLAIEGKAEKRGLGIWLGSGSSLYKMGYKISSKLLAVFKRFFSASRSKNVIT